MTPTRWSSRSSGTASTVGAGGAIGRRAGRDQRHVVRVGEDVGIVNGATLQAASLVGCRRRRAQHRARAPWPRDLAETRCRSSGARNSPSQSHKTEAPPAAQAVARCERSCRKPAARRPATADDFEDSLVAVCCSSASLRFIEQPHVLDRDHRLVGEGLYQGDLLVVKGFTSLRHSVITPTRRSSRIIGTESTARTFSRRWKSSGV